MKDLLRNRNWCKPFFLFVVMLFSVCFFPDAAKAAVRTIPNSQLDTVRNVTNVEISYSTLDRYEFHNMSGGSLYEYFYEATGEMRAAILIPLKSTTSAFEYTDFLDLYFKNVTTIGGRKINAQIHFDSCRVGKPYGLSGTEDGTVSIGTLFKETMWFGVDTHAGLYRGDKHTKITVTFSYDDNNEVVDMPFYQILEDIDATTDYGSQYSEAWEGHSGYTGDIFVFESNVLNISGMKLTATEGTDGDDSYLKSGAIVPSDTGRMTCTFSSGYCATRMDFYCSLDDNNLRTTKSADSRKTYEEGDDIVWEISQNINTFYNNVFTCYESLVLKDKLPDEVSYKKATLYANGVDVTSQYGTLRYDDSSKTVSYTVKSSLLSNTGFYDGKNLTLKIYTTAKNSGKTVLTAKNTATLEIGHIKKTTNMVEVAILPTFSVQTEATHATITSTQEGILLGGSKKVTWKAEQGFFVSSVKIDGHALDNVDESGGSYTFSDISDNHTVKVVCRPYFSVQTDIDHGTITDSTDLVKQGDEKEIHWSVSEGYYVKTVRIDGKEYYSGKKVDGYPDSYTFSDVDDNHTVAVKTARIPFLKITKTSDKNTYNCQETVMYTILAEQTIKDAVADEVVITDKDVTKGLDLDLSTLTVNREDAEIEKGENSFTIRLEKMEYGSPVRITVKAQVNNDTLEANEIRNTVTIRSEQTEEVKSDSDISIYYKVENEVSHGTITESDYGLDRGDSKRITYHPEKGYYLESVTIDGQSIDTEEHPESIVLENIRSNYAVNVVFAKIPSISIKKTANKKVYRSGDKVKYRIDISETIPGAVAKNVVVTDNGLPNGVEIDYSSLSCTADLYTTETGDNEFSVKVPELAYGEDIEVSFSADIVGKNLTSGQVENPATAVFNNTSRVTGTVTDEAGIVIENEIRTEAVNGTITDSFENVPIGEERTVSYQSEPGYYLKRILVDGKEVSVKKYAAAYSFEEVKESHDIKVVYQKIPQLQITKKSDSDTYQTGDTIHYTVCLSQIIENAVAENVVVTDTDITPGVEIMADSIQISGVPEGRYGVQTLDNGFSVLLPSLADKEELLIRYDAVIRDETLAGKEVRNNVSATCDFMEGDSPVSAEAVLKVANPPVVSPESNEEVEAPENKPDVPKKTKVEKTVKAPEPIPKVSPETGDNTPVTACRTLLIVSLLCILGILIIRKRTTCKGKEIF